MTLRRKPLDGDAAIAQAVDYLLRQFDALPKPTSAGTIINEGVGSTFTGPIEPTYLVASSEARADVQAVADYVCDGTDDQDEIQSALDALSQAGVLDFGTVRLSGGTFYLTDGITVHAGIGLVGEGNQTWIDFDFSAWTEDGHGIELLTDCRISDMEIWAGTLGAGFTGGYDWLHTAARCVVERIKFDDSGALTTMPFDYTVSIGANSTARDLQGATVITVEMAGNNSNIFGGSIDQLTFQGSECNAVGVMVATSITTSGGACNLIGCIANSATLTIESSNLTVLGGHYENIETTATFGNVATLQGVRMVSSGHCYLTGPANIVTGSFMYELEVEDDAVVTGNALLGDVTVNGTANTEAQGGVVSGNQASGHIILDGACGVMVEGNQRIETVSDYGIRLTTGADKNTVRHNVIRPDDGGTMSTGIDIATSDCNDNVIGENMIIATTPVSDSGTGTRQPDLIIVAFANSSDPLTTITGAQPYVVSEDMDLVDVEVVVGTAPTDASLIVDVNVGGASFWATQGAQPTIVSTGTNSGKTAPNQNASCSAGDTITIDIDQVGSTVAGSNMTVILRFRPRF